MATEIYLNPGMARMSTELYLWPYSDGENSSVPFSSLLAAFSGMEFERAPAGKDYRVVDDQGRFICDLWAGDASNPDDPLWGVVVRDPLRCRALWEGIYRFLSSGRILLLWPGGTSLLAAVAAKETLQHIPKDLIAEIGDVKVVSSADDLLQSLEAA